MKEYSATFKLNEPQEETWNRMRPLMLSAHLINVRIRVDGAWREFEIDWLKDVARSYREQGLEGQDA